MKSPQNNNIWIDRIFAFILALVLVTLCGVIVFFVLLFSIGYVVDLIKRPQEHVPMITDEMVLSLLLTILACAFLFVFAYKKLMRYSRK